MLKALLFSLLLLPGAAMAQSSQSDSHNGLYAISRTNATDKPFAENTVTSIQIVDNTFEQIDYNNTAKGTHKMHQNGRLQLQGSNVVLTYDSGSQQNGRFDKELSPSTHQMTDVLIVGNKHYYKTSLQ